MSAGQAPAPLRGGYRAIIFGKASNGRPAMRIMVIPGQTAPSASSSPLLTFKELNQLVGSCTPIGWTLPSEPDLKPLLQTLHVVQTTTPPPRVADPGLIRMRKALDTIIADLPAFLMIMRTEHERISNTGEPRFKSEQQMTEYEMLFASAAAVRNNNFWPTEKNTRSEEWHSVAKAIAFHAKSLWRANGPGAGLKQTSPVVLLIEKLLPLVGCGVRTPDAIVSQTVRSKRRAKKTPA